MASLTIRNVDDALKTILRVRAAENGRSMEEEARQILRHFLLTRKRSMGIGTRISQRFASVGGVDLPNVSRSLPRQASGFDSEQDT